MKTNLTLIEGSSSNPQANLSAKPKAGDRAYCYGSLYYGQIHLIISVNDITAKVQHITSGRTHIVLICDMEVV